MFQGGVESTNDDAIDLLFGAKTPGADQIVGGKKKAAEAQDPDEGPDPDDENQEGQDPDEGTQPAPKKKIVKDPNDPEGIHAKVSKKSTDEVADELFGKNEEGQDPEEGASKVRKPVAAIKKPAQDLEVDYKTLFQQMVADGAVGDVEVPEGREWDVELFKEALALNLKTQYDDLLDKKGPYGKAIIEFEDNGGNPGELLNLFREQRTVQEFDIASPEGQEEFLTSYLEAQGYSVKSIDRTIKALIDQGGEALKEEAEEKKALWDNEYKAEIDRTQKEQQLVAKQMEEQARNFNGSINKVITEDTELTPKDRKEIANYILSYSQKFNGHNVSQFYVDMTEIQKDPTAYLELAKFIKGLKTGDYKKKIADKTKKEVNAKTFLKVKNGNALTQKGGGEVPLEEGSTETNFVTYLTRKK